MEKIKSHPSKSLIASNALPYFEQHGATSLLAGRNARLGSLFTSERAVHYLNILYRMLLFKRDYELEPLYDDIYGGVIAAQSSIDTEYNSENFRLDIGKLAEWDLVGFRIEKQRLRGYRDNRKQKFRYRLSSETIHFLEWLEQRLINDLQSRGSDTRDLLGEMRGSLGELLRLLHQVSTDGKDPEDIARRVLFQLFKADDLCQEISAGLADLNGRLLFFLVKRYHIDEVRGLIREVDRYVETFLRQAYSLRQEILPLLARLTKANTLEKLTYCHEVMENNRLQDIGYRLQEIASLPEYESASAFLHQLLSQPACTFDTNYWNQAEKAEPPKPTKRIAGKTHFPKSYLGQKQPGNKPVQSMDEARLALLKLWLQEKIVVGNSECGLLSAGNLTFFDDFLRLVELARAGLLADGKRLSSIDYVLQPEQQEVLLNIAEQSLRHPEMTVIHKKNN